MRVRNSSVMILGIAGGNGLEHIDKNKFQKVYGVDINREYLTTVAERYSDFSDILDMIVSKKQLNEYSRNMFHALFK